MRFFTLIAGLPNGRWSKNTQLPHDEQENEDSDGQKIEWPHGFFILVWVRQRATRPFRQAGELGKGCSKRNIDVCTRIDGPSICVQNRTEVAFFQLEPCDQHSGTGNQQYQADDCERYLPEFKSQYACDNGSND